MTGMWESNIESRSIENNGQLSKKLTTRTMSSVMCESLVKWVLLERIRSKKRKRGKEHATGYTPMCGWELETAC